jgi:putative flippase GtrA
VIGVLKQALKFGAVGLGNTVITIATIIVLVEMFSTNVLLANLFGYATGISFSFFMNRSWTFKSTGTLTRTAPRYVALLLVAYIANVAVLAYGIKLGADPYLTQLAGMALYTAINFSGSRYYVFRPESAPNYRRATIA